MRPKFSFDTLTTTPIQFQAQATIKITSRKAILILFQKQHIFIVQQTFCYILTPIRFSENAIYTFGVPYFTTVFTLSDQLLRTWCHYKMPFYGNGAKFDFLNDMVCIYKIIIHPVWPMAKYRRVFWSRILRSNFFSLPNSTSENSATTPNLLCFDSELGRDVISVAGNQFLCVETEGLGYNRCHQAKKEPTGLQ